MKQFRALLESIAFAGLKPDVHPGQPQGMKWLRGLRVTIDRLLSGKEIKDPLYLTNRTAAQRVTTWALVALPCLLIIGAVALALSKDYFDPPNRAATKELTPAELSRKILPNLRQDIHIETNREVEVLEVHVQHDAQLKLTGSVRSNSSKPIGAVDLAFTLTDKTGSQVGVVTTKIENLAPKEVKTFQCPIPQENAAIALVRDVNPSR